MKFSHIASAVALAVALPTTAFAAFPDDCSVNDTFVAATACAGVYDGNNLGNATVLAETLTELTTAFGDLDWALSVADLSFTGGTTGTINFAGTIDGPFAIALKAGTGYSLYYYESASVTSLDYFAAPEGKELSHASLYLGDGTLIPGPIPEPSTYALMLAGLGAVGLVARRRRAQK